MPRLPSNQPVAVRSISIVYVLVSQDRNVRTAAVGAGTAISTAPAAARAIATTATVAAAAA